jgi:hypothetical protein
VRCTINFCVLNFFFLGLSVGLEDWKFSYELKLPYISIWYFFWLQIARWFQKCTNLVVLSFTCWNWSKFGETWKFHIFWPYLTSSGWNWPPNKKTFGISEQFAIRKSNISIYRATSIFDLHMRIFYLQGIGATDKPKKKIEVRRNWFTSHHSFLRLRKVKKIYLKSPQTKKTQPIKQRTLSRSLEEGNTLL